MVVAESGEKKIGELVCWLVSLNGRRCEKVQPFRKKLAWFEKSLQAIWDIWLWLRALPRAVVMYILDGYVKDVGMLLIFAIWMRKEQETSD